MSSSTKTFNEIFLKLLQVIFFQRQMNEALSFIATCCTVAQGETISFLKLLLSFCKDNRMNTELVIAYYTILQKNQFSVNMQKKKNVTATYCKSNSTKDLIRY